MLNDFVPAYFPLPQNPLWDGEIGFAGVGSLNDFVPGWFPVPQNPLWPTQKGTRDSLPAAPPITQAQINQVTTAKSLEGLEGCGCGGSCGGCGMGALSVPSWASGLPSPLNSVWQGVPVVYWAGGAIAALLILPKLLGGNRRRR